MDLTSHRRQAESSDTAVRARPDLRSILLLIAVAVVPSPVLVRLSTDVAVCWFLLWASGAAIQAWPRLRARLAPEPLGPIGRASRLVFGGVAIWAGLRVGIAAVAGQPLILWTGGARLNVAATLLLTLFSLYVGANMILAALKGWSGCEITATPRALFHWNVALVCPLFTPLDLLDNWVRRVGRFGAPANH